MDKDPATLDQGFTPLHVAAATGQSEMARLLLRNGAAKDPKTFEHLLTPLYVAAQCGQNETLPVLLEYAADVHGGTKEGLTPLEVAACNGFTKIVSHLLLAGAERCGLDGSHKSVSGDPGGCAVDPPSNCVISITIKFDTRQTMDSFLPKTVRCKSSFPVAH